MKINQAQLGIAMANAGFQSFKELAGKCGVSRTTLSYINNGKACKPAVAKKIADAVKVPLSDIVEG